MALRQSKRGLDESMFSELYLSSIACLFHSSARALFVLLGCFQVGFSMHGQTDKAASSIFAHDSVKICVDPHVFMLTGVNSLTCGIVHECTFQSIDGIQAALQMHDSDRDSCNKTSSVLELRFNCSARRQGTRFTCTHAYFLTRAAL